VDLDQRRRNLDNPHVARDYGSNADGEVDPVDTRHITAREHCLSDLGALLHAQPDVAVGLASPCLIPLVLPRLALLSLALVLLALRRLLAHSRLPVWLLAVLSLTLGLVFLRSIPLVALALGRPLTLLALALAGGLIALTLIALLGLTLLALRGLILLRLHALVALRLVLLALVFLTGRLVPLRLPLAALGLSLLALLLCLLLLRLLLRLVAAIALTHVALTALPLGSSARLGTAGLTRRHVLGRGQRDACHQRGRA
jgi:hypothetical protein